VPILRANPGVQIRIAGHADERGSVEYNLALGMRRANAVREYLAGFGIDVSRFDTVSMGEDMPLDPASTEAAWARNRRAEFTVTGGGATLVLPGS
jgi:peptidoglycan-associated lipoprotein